MSYSIIFSRKPVVYPVLVSYKSIFIIEFFSKLFYILGRIVVIIVDKDYTLGIYCL